MLPDEKGNVNVRLVKFKHGINKNIDNPCWSDIFDNFKDLQSEDGSLHVYAFGHAELLARLDIYCESQSFVMIYAYLHFNTHKVMEYIDRSRPNTSVAFDAYEFNNQQICTDAVFVLRVLEEFFNSHEVHSCMFE